MSAPGRWRYCGSLEVGQVRPFEDFPEALWPAGFSSVHGLNDRVPAHLAHLGCNSSLALVRPQQLQFQLGMHDTRAVLRAGFHYRGTDYLLRVTDEAASARWTARLLEGHRRTCRGPAMPQPGAAVPRLLLQTGRRYHRSWRARKSMNTIFTIGHSDHSLDEFLNLLVQHRISALADVRSSPSRSASPSIQPALAEALACRGIAYVSRRATGGDHRRGCAVR